MLRVVPMAVLFLWSLAGCTQQTVTDPAAPPDVGENEERIILTDRTGKEWDITYAVNKYGFDPQKFRYGLGPFAIQPLMLPPVLCPGDAGYPDDQATFLSIGINLFGVTRAYPLYLMVRHEISNELFAGNYVAVAY